MPGAPGDPWPLMPQTPARAIPGVRLKHDHRAHLSGSSVLHHPLIAGGTIVSSERGLAGARAPALDMVTQRGYSPRSVAHIAAVLPGVSACQGVASSAPNSLFCFAACCCHARCRLV